MALFSPSTLPLLACFLSTSLLVSLPLSATTFPPPDIMTTPSELSAYSDVTPGRVFSGGNFEVLTAVVRKRGRASVSDRLPPKPLHVWTAATSASLPVLLFQHGWSGKARWYSQLLSRVASHGFIVVAPQMYPVTTFKSAEPEIRDALAVMKWLHQNLPRLLSTRLRPHRKTSPDPQPDWNKFAIAGHSRGGAVAFAILRGLVAPSPIKLQAAVLVDPVDGSPDNSTFNSYMTLVHKPNSLSVSAPVLVIGPGLGSVPRKPTKPPCAPEYLGHKYFDSDLQGPAYHVVMPEYGHTDVGNEYRGRNENSSWRQERRNLCPAGPSRTPMQVTTAGVSIAFLRAKIDGLVSDLDDVWANPSHAPIRLFPIVSK